MKTRLLITVLFLFGVSINASALAASTLTLNVDGYEAHQVRFDYQWTSFSGNEFYFDELQPGNHHVRIVKLAYRSNGYGQHARIVFDGMVFIPGMTAISMRLTNRGLMQTVSSVAMFNIPDANCCHDFNPVTCASTYFPVTDDEFFRLRDAIARRTFESSRVEMSRQLLRDRRFTSAQVASLLEVFSFESSRLEVAKFAYSRTVDPHRYYVVYSAFTFESSIVELSRFIS